jgi:isopentenyl-diphosphate delta-isomerase
VSPEELREMMKEEKGLRWSPWFRIIVDRFLWKWWENIDEVFATDKFVDEQSIHEVLEEED